MSTDITAQTVISLTNEQFSGENGVSSPQAHDSDPRVVTENRPPVPSPEDNAELLILNNRKLEIEKKLSELYKDLDLINSKLEQHKGASTTTSSNGGKRGGRKRKVSPVSLLGSPPKKQKAQTPSKPAPKKPPPTVVPRPKRTRRKSTILREAEGTEVQLPPGLASCVTIMRSIMSHRWAGPFNVPVDPVALNISDYFLIIKHPMDFGTVKSKLESGQYEDVSDFCADMNLVFSNACTYNRPGSDVYVMAQTLQEVFKKKIKPIETREQQRERKAQLADDGGIIELKKSVDSICQELKLLIQTQSTTTSRGGRASTPKPEDPSMTKEEMKRLSTAINSLPFEHLSAIVQIINERLPPESVQSELDFDINVLDNATLRRLEAYVDSVKRKKNPRAKSPSQGLNTDTIQQMERQLQQLISKTGDQLVPTSGKTVVKGPEESESSDSESDSSSDSESSSDSDSDSESGSDSESDVD